MRPNPNWGTRLVLYAYHKYLASAAALSAAACYFVPGLPQQALRGLGGLAPAAQTASNSLGTSDVNAAGYGSGATAGYPPFPSTSALPSGSPYPPAAGYPPASALSSTQAVPPGFSVAGPAVDSFASGDSLGRSGRSVAPAAGPGVGRFRKLRLGSFNLDNLTAAKLADPLVADRLAELLGDFDCVAVQEVSAESRELLPRLVRLIRDRGRRFDYVAGEPTGDEPSRERLAFLFDADRVHVDRSESYTLNDPQDVLGCEPLVGWFRSAEPEPSQAWTFTFVNCKFGRTGPREETPYLPEVLESIRQDGRGEDDIVVAGSFCGSVEGGRERWRVLPQSSSEWRSGPAAAILLPPPAGDEFTGESGQVSILRRCNIDPQQAAAVSSHPPVWADFYAAETPAGGWADR